MKDKNFFAVDLGATSGRTILGTLSEGKFEMKELTRFPNNIIEVGGHFYWDIYALYHEIIRGLKVVAQEGIKIESIGIETWGVDFVCFGKDGGVMRSPYCYRDPHTFSAMEEFFNVIPKEKVYDVTGIQFLNFNSLFQLYALKRDKSSALEAADKILFIPDALSYMLTGKMVTEYTIASTSMLLNAKTKDWSDEILNGIGFPKELLPEVRMPGQIVGRLLESVQQETGLGPIPVALVGSHDTASAVAGIPYTGENHAFVSSGTWSLMGMELDEPMVNEASLSVNFTNEGGAAGTIRFLKNIFIF